MRLDVGLALDPLQVPRTLCIAITCSEFGTSLVVTILVHLDKVNGSIETTVCFGHINSDRHLLANQIELFVLAVLSDEETGAHIDGVWALCDVTKLHSTAGLVDTVRGLPLLLGPTTNSTLLGASLGLAIL